MKAIFKVTNENVGTYNKATKGYGLVSAEKEISQLDFFNEVKQLEDVNFFKHDNIVTDCDGNAVWDNASPFIFDFQDYYYILIDSSELEPEEFEQDEIMSFMIKAVKLK